MDRQARDVMETHVITVSPELPLLDLHRVFVEEEIHGAPVVDETGRVLGIVSSADLLRAVDDEGATHSGPPPAYLRELFEERGGFALPDELHARLEELCVSDIMTSGGVTVSPETPIDEVASQMRRYRIHRLPVVSGSRLEGIVTTFDLIALLEKEPAAPGDD
ncbi:MAG: CBS domain-containing protein [Myxococcota bacterium]